MDRNNELDNILYLKGICLSEEQIISFKKTINAVNVLGMHIQEIVHTVFQEQIKPISDIMRDFITKIKELKNKLIEPKIRYQIVKEIKPKVYLRLNKPQIIHCRNNC